MRQLFLAMYMFVSSPACRCSLPMDRAGMTGNERREEEEWGEREGICSSSQAVARYTARCGCFSCEVMTASTFPTTGKSRAIDETSTLATECYST